MVFLKKKLINCPHCGESRYYKSFEKFEEHRKLCGLRYKNKQRWLKVKSEIGRKTRKRK